MSRRRDAVSYRSGRDPTSPCCRGNRTLPFSCEDRGKRGETARTVPDHSECTQPIRSFPSIEKTGVGSERRSVATPMAMSYACSSTQPDFASAARGTSIPKEHARDQIHALRA